MGRKAIAGGTTSNEADSEKRGKGDSRQVTLRHCLELRGETHDISPGGHDY